MSSQTVSCSSLERDAHVPQVKKSVSGNSFRSQWWYFFIWEHSKTLLQRVMNLLLSLLRASRDRSPSLLCWERCAQCDCTVLRSGKKEWQRVWYSIELLSTDFTMLDQTVCPTNDKSALDSTSPRTQLGIYWEYEVTSALYFSSSNCCFKEERRILRLNCITLFNIVIRWGRRYHFLWNNEAQLMPHAFP